jgi:hypothetical protein
MAEEEKNRERERKRGLRGTIEKKKWGRKKKGLREKNHW